jgi:toxin-antitoxin system PIN domain toxin
LIVVDANLLLYAYHAGAAQHSAARSWLEDALAGAEPVGLSWSTIHAFLRIGTNPRVFERPYSIEDATAIVSAWLDLPSVVILRPGDRYWTILQALLIEAQAHAGLITDAALAALAMENGGVLYSTDRDFRRFPGLKLRNPLDAA